MLIFPGEKIRRAGFSFFFSFSLSLFLLFFSLIYSFSFLSFFLFPLCSFSFPSFLSSFPSSSSTPFHRLPFISSSTFFPFFSLASLIHTACIHFLTRILFAPSISNLFFRRRLLYPLSLSINGFSFNSRCPFLYLTSAHLFLSYMALRFRTASNHSLSHELGSV